MTNPENLRRGDWVAISGHACNECGECHSQFTGEPHRVLACSHPFLLLRLNEGGSRGLDLREWQVTRVDARYARAFLRSNCEPDEQRERDDEPDDGHKRCVRCGTRLQQRRGGANPIVRGDAVHWRWFCPECGADGGRVEATR